MEKSKKDAALNAAGVCFNDWILLCICFNFAYKVVNEEVYPLLLINPLWSAHFDGFGGDYRLSDEDEDGIQWIVICKDDKFDPELYNSIVSFWKFHHNVM